MKQAFYFHGGPGFNANPEIHLLIQPLTEAGFTPYFWQEPSSARPGPWPFTEENAFDNLLRSAEAFFLQYYSGNKAVLVTHSFSCRIGLYIAARHHDKIATIVIITPGFYLNVFDRNVFGLSIADFTAQQDDKAQQLKQVLANYTGQFDDNTITGFALVSQNPNLFNHYWHNKAMMQAFLAYYAPPYGIDITAYMAVRKTHYALPVFESSLPAIMIFGKYDELIDEEQEKQYVKKFFSSCTEVVFDASSHYPHMEEMDRFIEILKTLPA